MASKRNKIRKARRPFDRDSFFVKKDREDLPLKKFILEREFPDPKERQEYIWNLIHGLETEPILEN